MKSFGAVLTSVIISLATTGAVSAAPIHLGSGLKQVKALYSKAISVDLPAGAHALELSDIDYDGVRWARVDFIFDANSQLTSLAMHTKALSFDQALELASRQEAGVSRLEDTKDAGLEITPMEIRVCEDDDGEVTFSFEQRTAVS